jgi:hypothetical protein
VMLPEKVTRQRCGPCIDADQNNIPELHDKCVVEVEMGNHSGRGPKSKVAGAKDRWAPSYVWRCGCNCQTREG